MKFNDLKSAVTKCLISNGINIKDCDIKKGRKEVGSRPDGTPNYELFIEVTYKGKTIGIFSWMVKSGSMDEKIKTMSNEGN